MRKIFVTFLTLILFILLAGIAHASMGPLNPTFGRIILLVTLLAPAYSSSFAGGPQKGSNFSTFLVVVLLLTGITIAVTHGPPVYRNLPDKAIWGTGKANIDIVRSALVSYAADSPDEKYPVGKFNYKEFRELFPQVHLPEWEGDCKWKEGSFHYNSVDGKTFIVSACAGWRTDGTIFATPDEILPENYNDHLYLFVEGSTRYWGYWIFYKKRIDLLRQQFIDAGQGGRMVPQ
jgi:hypothetical protein